MQQFMQKHSGFVETMWRYESQSAAPSIAICFIFNDACLFSERERVRIPFFRIFWYSRRKRKVRSGVERRIDVDEIDLARELRQERWQHVFLIAPNQPIAPLLLAKSWTKRKGALSILCQFIDGLDGLKRQCHPQRRHAPAIGVVFAFPCQLRASWPSHRGFRNRFARRFLCGFPPQSGVPSTFPMNSWVVFHRFPRE